MTATKTDDVTQTLAEYERLAISTGARVQIDPPEFSADGVAWSPIWLSTEPPVAARATVHRDGTPTTFYATWAESLPLETAVTPDGVRWVDIWIAKPMQRFGSFVVRSALRRAFRDVIGDRIEPDEDSPRTPAEAPADRDWDAAILAATTTGAVTSLHTEMKRARAVTIEREAALMERLDLLNRETPADAWATPETVTIPAAVADADAVTIRQPQDYRQPENRAARRKAARKKGGRR